LINSARAALLGSAVYWPTTWSVTSVTQAPSGWVWLPSAISRVAKLTAWRGSVPTSAMGNEGMVNSVLDAQLASCAARSIT
jgi:hypothetical protein